MTNERKELLRSRYKGPLYMHTTLLFMTSTLLGLLCMDVFVKHDPRVFYVYGSFAGIGLAFVYDFVVLRHYRNRMKSDGFSDKLFFKLVSKTYLTYTLSLFAVIIVRIVVGN